MLDNLNTHHPASLYEALPIRIAERLEIHYTPKHGSWLNMAEIEIGQCLIKRCCAGKLTPGRTSATGTWCEWTGASPPMSIKLKSLLVCPLLPS